jgi:hypothetical protein
MTLKPGSGFFGIEIFAKKFQIFLIFWNNIIDRMARHEFSFMINPEMRFHGDILAKNLRPYNMIKRRVFMKSIPNFTGYAGSFQ